MPPTTPPTGLRVQRNAPLSTRNTLRVAATAPRLIEVPDRPALDQLLGSGLFGTEPVLVLGEGSNLLFAADPEGAVVHLGLSQISVREESAELAVVRADAGVRWHELVQWTLARQLEGLENLALIPGHVGAAPVQNIGAYGTEVSEFIAVVEAFDRTSGELRSLDNAACGFGYRDSVFKRQPNRWMVTAVEFHLPHHHALRLDYAGVRDELATMGVTAPRASDVAEAVTQLRRRKLPDPAMIGNAGSFFKNPVVDAATAAALGRAHPSLPMYPESGGTGQKLSAAWLIGTCGWKGHRDGDAGIAERHALVLVNHGHATGAQLLDLARRVAGSVRTRFGISLEPEPRIIGARW